MEIHHHALKTISAFKIFQRDSTDFCSLFCLPAWKELIWFDCQKKV